MKEKKLKTKIILIEVQTSLSNSQLKNNAIARMELFLDDGGACLVEQVTVHTCQPPKKQ